MAATLLFSLCTSAKSSGRCLWFAQILILLQGHVAKPSTRRVMSSWQRFVPTTCPMSPKLLLHNYDSIGSHEGTRRCNMSLRHVPATFLCVCKRHDFVLATRPHYMSPQCLLHNFFCRCYMSLWHVSASWPLVFAHLKQHYWILTSS